MDNRLQEALDFSNYRLTLSTQLSNLKIKLASDLLITHQNGIFTVSVDKILYCKQLIDQNTLVFPFVDDNDVPILITNLPQFYELMDSTYKRAMTQYQTEYAKVVTSRNIKKIVDYNE